MRNFSKYVVTYLCRDTISQRRNFYLPVFWSGWCVTKSTHIPLSVFYRRVQVSCASVITSIRHHHHNDWSFFYFTIFVTFVFFFPFPDVDIQNSIHTESRNFGKIRMYTVLCSDGLQAVLFLPTHLHVIYIQYHWQGNKLQVYRF